MILCHKCSGILAAEDTENTDGLLNCGCMSGWVRGFEPIVTRLQAAKLQIAQQAQRIDLYTRQNRPPDWVRQCLETQKHLEAILQGESQ